MLLPAFTVGERFFTDGHEVEVIDLNATCTDCGGDTDPGIECLWVTGPSAGESFTWRHVDAERDRASTRATARRNDRDFSEAVATIADALSARAQMMVTGEDEFALDLRLTERDVQKLARLLS